MAKCHSVVLPRSSAACPPPRAARELQSHLFSGYATALSAQEMRAAQGDPEPCWEIPPDSGRLQKAPRKAKQPKGMKAFR